MSRPTPSFTTHRDLQMTLERTLKRILLASLLLWGFLPVVLAFWFHPSFPPLMGWVVLGLFTGLSALLGILLAVPALALKMFLHVKLNRALRRGPKPVFLIFFERVLPLSCWIVTQVVALGIGLHPQILNPLLFGEPRLEGRTLILQVPQNFLEQLPQTQQALPRHTTTWLGNSLPPLAPSSWWQNFPQTQKHWFWIWSTGLAGVFYAPWSYPFLVQNLEDKVRLALLANDSNETQIKQNNFIIVDVTTSPTPQDDEWLARLARKNAETGGQLMVLPALALGQSPRFAQVLFLRDQPHLQSDFLFVPELLGQRPREGLCWPMAHMTPLTALCRAPLTREPLLMTPSQIFELQKTPLFAWKPKAHLRKDPWLMSAAHTSWFEELEKLLTENHLP